MKNYIKNSVKILANYGIVLIIFVVFIYVFMSVTKDKFNQWLSLYSILMFLFAFMMIYSDMKSLAVKEKRPQYDLHPYPLKGLVYGLIGIIPIALLVSVAALINLGNDVVERIKHLAINTFLGPMYFVIRWLKESPLGYGLAILLIPMIAMLGYLAGYYGINIMEKLKKKKAVAPEKGMTKSPWNPSIGANKSTDKKKKKVNKIS